MELEPEAGKRLVIAKTMGLEADELPKDDLRPYRYIFLFRINIGSIPSEDVSGYISNASNVLCGEDLKRRGILCYFIPTRDEPTSLSIIDLETMVVGKL